MLEWYEMSQEVRDYALKSAILGMISKCYIYFFKKKHNIST